MAALKTDMQHFEETYEEKFAVSDIGMSCTLGTIMRSRERCSTTHELACSDDGASESTFSTRTELRKQYRAGYIALDFTFPAPSLPLIDTSKKSHLGHNFYSTFYRHDFSSSLSATVPTCPCAIYAPQRHIRIFHGVDEPSDMGEKLDAFSPDVCGVLTNGDTETWKFEIQHFEEMYNELLAVPLEETE
ncbi:hypothetical protein BDQ17DRAFT_1412270 [Cyathus striatus]|nr:hypothetical protein BDQ17DRAFT_1412270 [Cyathus striatus]